MGKRIAIMASGNGSNLQAILDAWRSGQLTDAEVKLVVCNKEDVKALDRARAAGVSSFFLDPSQYPNRVAFDEELIRCFAQKDINLICLAGYMQILTSALVQSYPLKIMNIHPALLPAFGGKGMYGHHVHEQVIASGAKFSGCTVHFVDEGTDTGPIILQAAVPVLDQDTPKKLAERILIEEHRLYPRAVALYCENRLQITGQRVRILERA